MKAEIVQRVTQTRLHDPDSGVRGNCVAACLSSLFGSPIELFDHIIDEDHWWAAFELACLCRGFLPVRLAPDFADGTPSGVCIASGLSPRGIRHMCLYENGKLAHDPHPSRAGIEEVDTWTVLVPWRRA